jgi:hypothetical protein
MFSRNVFNGMGTHTHTSFVVRSVKDGIVHCSNSNIETASCMCVTADGKLPSFLLRASATLGICHCCPSTSICTTPLHKACLHGTLPRARVSVTKI